MWTDSGDRTPRAAVECLSLEAEAAWVVLILVIDSASPEARGDFSRCVLT